MSADIDRCIGMGNYPEEWRPSTDIADAWRVVERLGELGMQINVGHAGERLDRWEANVYQIFRSVDESDRVDVEVGADTAPEAICKAALAAVRAMKGEG